MKIGYLCYRLSGNGPRTRAADIISAVAEETDHEVVVLTNQPEKVRGPAEVRPISLSEPLSTLSTAKEAFADADLVHVPINTYQVLFVRSVYRGPLVAGVGPGIQPSYAHRAFGRLLGIDTKIKVHEGDRRWDAFGYETAVCTATIDPDVFYPYDETRRNELRSERDLGDATVVLYVGKLSEEQGAHLVSEMARLTRDDESIRYIVAGDGPLADRFENRDDLTFEGFVDNKTTPDLYNVADVTVAPRRFDNTSNVGLESIACGTPMVTTAGGSIVDLFEDRGTYVWADERTAESVLEAVRELTGDPDYYDAQVQRGLDVFEEMNLTIDSALELHCAVYEEVASESAGA